jgi:hypothetical protein
MKANDSFYYEPDKLAESFLTEYYVFAPGDGGNPLRRDVSILRRLVRPERLPLLKRE